MSLIDFLGNTSEIVILDFLMGNPGTSYTIAEISQLTGLSRTTIYGKLPVMMANRLVEIDDDLRQVKTFKLCDNATVNNLYDAVFAHSFSQADDPLQEDEAVEKMMRRVGPLTAGTGTSSPLSDMNIKKGNDRTTRSLSVDRR
ncbi:MAG TPA: helix-turn-helix domain-containing protein [Methanocella sp.]|jgi:predicted transcriptional regulator